MGEAPAHEGDQTLRRRAGDALAEAVVALGDLDGSERTIAVPVAGDEPEADRAELQPCLYAGLFALLAEDSVGLMDAEHAVDRLQEALRVVRSTEPGARFARFERRDATERRELMVRMREREIAMTDRWLIPRLRSDISAYRARISALRRAMPSGQDGAR